MILSPPAACLLIPCTTHTTAVTMDTGADDNRARTSASRQAARLFLPSTIPPFTPPCRLLTSAYRWLGCLSAHSGGLPASGSLSAFLAISAGLGSATAAACPIYLVNPPRLSCKAPTLLEGGRPGDQTGRLLRLPFPRLPPSLLPFICRAQRCLPFGSKRITGGFASPSVPCTRAPGLPGQVPTLRGRPARAPGRCTSCGACTCPHPASPRPRSFPRQPAFSLATGIWVGGARPWSWAIYPALVGGDSAIFSPWVGLGFSFFPPLAYYFPLLFLLLFLHHHHLPGCWDQVQPA